MTPNDDHKTKALGELQSVANFFFELGMLKRTPRSGFQFLGSGKESVADHTFRAAVIGFSLAKMSGAADPFKVACICLFHDLAEARTGDLNYVNKNYVKADETKAVRDLSQALPFADEVVSLIEEYRTDESAAAKLAHDADQLDLIVELKEQSDLGNRYAKDWITYVIRRLQTDVGELMARTILDTDYNAWWFADPNHRQRQR